MRRKGDLTTEKMQKRETGEANFYNLPVDIIEYMANQFLSLSDTRRLANTCKKFLFFTPEIKLILIRANAKVLEFLTCVKNSDLARVKQMLLVDPGLVLEGCSIGEYQHITGLQLVRNLGDADMCKMMLECAAAGGVAVEVPRQTNRNKLLDENHFDQIAAVIANCDESTVKAEIMRHRTMNFQMTDLSKEMDKYRKICDAHGEMTPQDVLNAFSVLNFIWFDLVDVEDNNFCDLNKKVKLFLLQVIGYVERLTPIWFRQAMAQGLGNVMSPNVVLRRLTECNVAPGVNYPVVSLVPFSGFGFDFMCDELDTRGGNRFHDCQGSFALRGFQDFVKKLNRDFNELNRLYQPKADEPVTKRLNM